MQLEHMNIVFYTTGGVSLVSCNFLSVSRCLQTSGLWSFSVSSFLILRRLPRFFLKSFFPAAAASLRPKRSRLTARRCRWSRVSVTFTFIIFIFSVPCARPRVPLSPSRKSFRDVRSRRRQTRQRDHQLRGSAATQRLRHARTAAAAGALISGRKRLSDRVTTRFRSISSSSSSGASARSTSWSAT